MKMTTDGMQRPGVLAAGVAVLAISAVLTAAPIDKKSTTFALATSSKPASTSTKPATTKGASTKPKSTVVIVRTKLKMDAAETELTDLLAAGQKDDARVAALKVSYRMVERRMYEAAASAKSDDLRAVLALRADKLSDSQVAFDAFAARALEWRTLVAKAGSSKEEAKIKASLQAALKSMDAFEKATDKVSMEMEDGATLRKFVTEMFGPLEPAVLMDNNDVPLPNAWPELPKAPSLSANDLPAPEATATRLQKAPVTPDLREELQTVLPKLADAMSTPETANAATEQYKVYLDVLKFAEQLGSNEALSLDARTELNQQLRRSFVLFKDPRTRDSAMKRLAGVGGVASALTHLDQSALDPQQKQIVGAAMHQSIQKLNTPLTAKSAQQMLGSLDHLMTAYGQFTRMLEQQPMPSAKEEWKKVRLAGEAQMTTVIERLQTDAETARVEDTAKRLENVVRNFEVLASMPELIRRTESFKPKPPAGMVERRMVVWARAIAETPDSTNAAAEEIRLFARAAGVIESAHTDGPPPDADAQQLATITADRYKVLMTKATDNETKLLTALSSVGAPLGPLVQAVEADTRLRRATQSIMTIQNDGVLERLNRWGAWQLEASARTLLVTELTRTVANAYMAQTTINYVPLVEPSVSLAMAEDALDRLITMDRRLKEKLPVKATNWSLGYAAVVRSPTERTILISNADKFAQVCLQLNEAACNVDNGGSEDAVTGDLKSAIETLAGIGLDK